MKKQATSLLITGGAGFIGSELVRQAVAKGHHVTVLDKLTYAGKRENLEGIQNCRLVVGDIADSVLVGRLLSEQPFSAVLNVAAESHVDNSISAPNDFIQTNILGTYSLLETVRAYWNTLEGEAKTTFRYLQVSTDEVFGTLGPKDKPFTEETPYQPNSPYSASKAAADHLVRAWHHTYGLPTLTTHCTNNYGPRQFPEKLIPLAIQRMREGKTIPLYGDGQQVRDWIHVTDHSSGILLALKKGTPGETYAFGGRAELPNRLLLETLCGVMDELSPRADGQLHVTAITYVPDRPGHDRRYAINDNKAEKTLGFTRAYTLQEGLRQTVKWYLSAGTEAGDTK